MYLVNKKKTRITSRNKSARHKAKRLAKNRRRRARIYQRAKK
jgi:hypothetical protein